MAHKVVKFTLKDLFCESGGLLLQIDFLGAWGVIDTGLAYNDAVYIGEPELIAEAYKRLHPELRLFKHNFLSRGKDHW